MDQNYRMKRDVDHLHCWIIFPIAKFIKIQGPQGHISFWKLVGPWPIRRLQKCTHDKIWGCPLELDNPLQSDGTSILVDPVIILKFLYDLLVFCDVWVEV